MRRIVSTGAVVTLMLLMGGSAAAQRTSSAVQCVWFGVKRSTHAVLHASVVLQLESLSKGKPSNYGHALDGGDPRAKVTVNIPGMSHLKLISTGSPGNSDNRPSLKAAYGNFSVATPAARQESSRIQFDVRSAFFSNQPLPLESAVVTITE